METALFIMFLVLLVRTEIAEAKAKRRNAKIEATLDLILSQIQIDHHSIEIPDDVHMAVSSYLDESTECDPLLVNKSVLRKKAIDNAISCLVQELQLPRKIAEQIITTRYSVDLKAEL